MIFRTFDKQKETAMLALQQASLNGPQDLPLITGAPVPSPGPGGAA